MKFDSIPGYPYAFALVAAIFLCGLTVRADDPIIWKPIDSAQVQMKTPVVDKDADAEALLWEVTIDDKKTGKLIYRHYVRVKIFTERGREKFAKMDIPYVKGRKIEDVAARVTKADGAIIDLPPSEIFEREIVRANKVKVMAKSFAVPGIEPGVIVEYQYSEIIKNDSASGERISFQRDIPMQKAVYRVRPYAGQFLRATAYNMESLDFVEDRENKGFRVATLENLPALKLEPYMPPEDEVRKWGYLSYRDSNWTSLSWAYGALLRDFAKETKVIKAKSAELTAGAATPDEKLRRIYAFVQSYVKNASYDRSLNDEQRERIKIRDVEDVLEKRIGNGLQIDLLFSALARSAGFETGVFLASDRSDYFFSPQKYPHAEFIVPSGVAVLVGGTWKYFDPCGPFLPYGEVSWQSEGAQALVIGTGGMAWKGVPIADNVKNPTRRIGKFKLSEDGTLEGKVTIEYSGTQATRRRREGYLSSQTKREEDVIEEAKENVKNGEITNVFIDNFEDASKPLTYTFNVRVPAYAQKTGKRLFVQPGFFEYGSNPAFSASERIHPIYFPYSWAEQDGVEIELPKGYELDSAESPGDVSDPSNIGRLQIQMGIDKATSTLKYRRSFFFGANGKILFPSNVYSAMKDLFSAFHKADTHIVTLKQGQ